MPGAHCPPWWQIGTTAVLQAIRMLEPFQIRRIDADHIKQAWLQIGHDALTGQLADDRAEERRAGAVVIEGRARCMHHRNGEECLDPVGIPHRRHGDHAGPHAQDIAHGQLEQMSAWIDWNMFRKDIHDTVFQSNKTLVIGDANRRGGIGFGQRLEAMPNTRGVWRPPAFGRHLAMPDDHQPMHLGAAGFQRIEEVINVGAGKSDRFRGDTFEGLFVHWFSCLRSSMLAS